MAQTFTSTDVVTTTNVFGDNQSQRVNENTLRSSFSGPTQPSNPVVGQVWYDTTNNKQMQYNGTAWVPVDTNGTTQVDVNNAKGNLTSLTSYLRVAHNDDGTLKTSPATAIDEFKDNALVVTYVSANTFTVPMDLTTIFTNSRKLKVYLESSTVITYVLSSSYSSGNNRTTVVTGEAVLNSSVTAIKYSIIQYGMPQDYNLSLKESTGYGVISGGSATASGLTVTIAAVIAHMPNGNRYNLPQSTITVNAADATNPRIDLIYLSSAGVVSYLEGTAAGSPSVPSVPAGGLTLHKALVGIDGTIALTDLRGFKTRYQNSGIVNVKDFGVVGDGVNDDTEAFQRAVNSGYILSASVEIRITLTSTITITHSDLTIIGSCGFIYSTASVAFLFPAGTQRCAFKDLYLVGNGSNTLAKFSGVKTNESTQIINMTFTKCWIDYFDLAFDCKCLRRSYFSDLYMNVNKGFLIQNKTAENNIEGCYLARYGAIATSYGIKCITDDSTPSTVTDYPEGIVITDTIFNYFDIGVKIYDLFVGLIKGCQFDCNIPIWMDYNVKNQNVVVDNGWVGPTTISGGSSKMGIYFHPTSATSPKEYRAIFSNLTFDTVPSYAFRFANWASAVQVHHIVAYGDTSTSIFSLAENNNQAISISDITMGYYIAGVYFKLSGSYNNISRIRFLTTPTLTYSFEYPVNAIDCDNYKLSQSANIANGLAITQGSIIGTLSGNYSHGKYLVQICVRVTITTAGNIQLVVPSGGTICSYSSYREVATADNRIAYDFIVDLANDVSSGTFTIKSISDTSYCAGTVAGYHGNFSITKIG